MKNRNLSLKPRLEDTRDKKAIEPVILFSLDEIKMRFNKTIEDIEGYFILAELLVSEDKNDCAEDVYRSQIVFLESALDFYIHEISKYGIISIFADKWKKTEKYNNFKIPMCVLEKGIKNPESTQWLADHINKRFGFEVYLSFDSMKDQLNMLGLPFFDIIIDAFPFCSIPDDSFKYGKSIIDKLFERRNHIAHQSDRKHSTAEKNDISREYVESSISHIKSLVDTIHKAASDHISDI